MRSQLFKHTTNPQETIVGLDQSPYEEQSTSGLLDDLIHFYQLGSEEHTSELQSHSDLVCRLLLEKKKKKNKKQQKKKKKKREKKEENYRRKVKNET